MRQTVMCSWLLALVLCGGLQAASIVLDPVGGALVGRPGETVGWGFTLESSTDFLVVTSVDYLTLQPLGVFTDFISQFNFIVAGPSPESPSVTQAFDLLALTGIGSYQIDINAPNAALSTGFLMVTYDLYSVSPNDPGFDPALDLLSSGNLFQVAASVTADATPEPASFLLLTPGLAGIVALRRRSFSRGSRHAIL